MLNYCTDYTQGRTLTYRLVVSPVMQAITVVFFIDSYPLILLFLITSLLPLLFLFRFIFVFIFIIFVCLASDRFDYMFF